TFQEMQGPGIPSPGESDLKSFTALQKWEAQVYGFRLPEGEYHQTWDSTSDGRPKNPHDFPGSQYFATVLTNPKKYAKIPVPALAIFAIPHVPQSWITESNAPDVHKSAEAYFPKIDLLTEKQAKAFEDGIPGARVIRLRGMHYIFISNEPVVLREMRAFI